MSLRNTVKAGLRAAGLGDAARLGVQLAGLGLDLRRLPATAAALPWFVRSWRAYAALAGESPRVVEAYPCLFDRGDSAGSASGHYFHQDLWAARKVFDLGVRAHVDVGSRVDGFVVGSVLELPFADRSQRSLSCLHVIEHVGLGRYGDPLDPQGTLKALAELQRVLAPGGDLLVGVPVGRERVCFNAHRVLAPTTVIATMSELTLREFSAVDDRGALVRDASPEHFAGADYACGLFHFTR